MSSKRGLRRRRPPAVRARPPAAGTAARRRLAPGERRRQLIDIAARLMSGHGMNAVQFGQIATLAGVTRQLVYKVFPSRQALIAAVLEDYVAALADRFGRGAALAVPGSMETATRVFVEAVCDTIDAKGAGPWHLLGATGSDPAIAKLSQQLQDRLTAPWRPRIAETLGIGDREAGTLLHLVVAAGRAVLELWYGGWLTREEAVRDTTRGVSALLQAFSVPRAGSMKGPSGWRRPARRRSRRRVPLPKLDEPPRRPRW